jgi:hypothetical protein
VRFCACVREISKQSQVSPKAHHNRRILLLKKSCHKELLCFYAQQNARHCSRACAATTSCPGTSALQPPLHRCVSKPGKLWRCSHVCAAATSRPVTSALQPLLRRCVLMPDKCPALQPCVRRCHVTPGDLLAKPWCCSHVCAAATSHPGLLALQLPLRLDAPAAMRALLPRHARGHWCCSRCCIAAS